MYFQKCESYSSGFENGGSKIALGLILIYLATTSDILCIIFFSYGGLVIFSYPHCIHDDALVILEEENSNPP